MEEKTTTQDVIKTLLGGAFVVAAVWGISQIDEAKTVIRYVFAFLLWLVAIYATMTYEFDWKNWSFKRDWPEIVGRIFGVVVWTIIIYIFAVYGIGMEADPWENV